jgi:Tfp pilus assembly protein PilP
VARAATQEDVIRLRDMNLIGVYGRQNARRALVRLPNGRYVRVEVGSTLDGGQVTAIGDTALNYVKRGRTYAIDMP